ncbi:MAG: YIP1 family protein [Desulfatiglandaceae bacterium]|jgi:hypothetical protein
MIIDITCPFCQLSKRVPSEKIPDTVKWVTCPRCRQRFEFNKKEAEKTSTVPPPLPRDIPPLEQKEEEKEGPSRGGGPWEDRADHGLWQGFLQTFKQVCFSPETFFKNLTYGGGKKEPLALGVLTGSIGNMLSFFWQSLFLGGLMILGLSFFSTHYVGLIFLLMMLVIPLMVAVGIFVYSGVLHLLLLMVRGGGNGFEATFRVVSYSQVVQVLGVIPFIGGLIGWIWRLIIQVIGLREIHETSYLRVIMAFLIPVFLFIVLFLAFLIPLAFLIFRHPVVGQIWS